MIGVRVFDRDDEDEWGKQWAEAYLAFASGEKRSWLAAKGVKVALFDLNAEAGEEETIAEDPAIDN